MPTLPKKGFCMAAHPILADTGNHQFQAISTQVREDKEKALNLKQRIKGLLYKVLSGHEEFLGLTPD
jgi:hypothetical protein